MTYKLVLLRHGESEWNAKNLFTGWVDVPLSEKGRAEAARGGEFLKESGVLPDLLFTSMLRRAIMTANLALDAADRHWIPVERNWRLNERHYGALQGKNKKEIRDEYGEDQFMQWRRSYDVPPPAIEAGSEFSQDTDPRYAGEPIPMTECLGRHHRPGNQDRQDRHDRRTRQLVARHRQAPRRNLRRGHCRRQHPDRYPPCLRAG